MTKEVTFEMVPGGILCAGRSWSGGLDPEELSSILAETPRREIKHSNGRPWRAVLIYDKSGIYLLTDVEENRSVYLGFAFVPSETSFPPLRPFSGRILLNGVVLEAGMDERRLPLKGTLNFVRGIGSTWKFAHDHGYVELNLKRLPMKGARRGPLRLVSMTHSFIKE